MIGIDTNVLLRFLVADDPEQHRASVRFVADRNREARVFVSLVVFVETVWVLRRVRGYRNDRIAAALSRLLMSDDFMFEEQEFLTDLLSDGSRIEADIPDHVIGHLARKAGCSHTVTFDKDAAKAVDSMKLLT